MSNCFNETRIRTILRAGRKMNYLILCQADIIVLQLRWKGCEIREYTSILAARRSRYDIGLSIRDNLRSSAIEWIPVCTNKKHGCLRMANV